MLPKRLSGKTVLVIGAAGNLGPRWVQALLAEGAHVVGLGLGVTQDETLRSLQATAGDSLVLAEVDVTQDNTLASLGVVCGREFGPGSIHGVVMNAGIDSIPGQGKINLADYDRGEWERVFDVNVFGVVAVMNTLLPALASPSSIVMLGSLYGLVSPKPALYDHFHEGQGSVKHPAYGASKAALVAVSRQYATHLAPEGIRVNTLTLGGVAAGQDAEFVTKFENHVPQGRMLSVDDVVGGMLFLMSDDSVAVTGHNLVVDGGFTAW